MRRTSTSLLAALAMVLSVSAAAHAYPMTFEPGGSITATSSSTFTGGSTSVICPITLSGTLSRTSIEATAGRQIGSVSGVRIGSCSGGSIEAVLNLPWSITIDSFLGELPSELTGMLVDISHVSFNIEIFGGFVNCLYRGTAAGLWSLRSESTGAYTTGSLRALETVELPLESGGFGCPSRGHFSGTFTVTSQRLTVTPHQFTVEPTRTTARGTVELRTPLGTTSCTSSFAQEFEAGPIALTREATYGVITEASLSCEAIGGVPVRFRALFPWQRQRLQAALFIGGVLIGILGRFRVAILVEIGPEFRCLYEGEAGVLVERNALRLLRGRIPLKIDLNNGTGTSCGTEAEIIGSPPFEPTILPIAR